MAEYTTEPQKADTGTSGDVSKRIVLSTVIKAEDANLWYNASYMVPHEPIRHWMNMLDEYVADNEALDAVAHPWKMDNFFKFYLGHFYDMVHHHHDVEEQMFVPWAQSKGIASPPKLMGDHVSLMAALDGIKAKASEWRVLQAKAAGSGGQEGGDEIKSLVLDVRKAVGEMTKAMRPHLAEEEEFYPQAMCEKGITHQEFQKLEQRIVKSLGLKGARIGLPNMMECMVRWSGPEGAETFRKNLPGPLRYLLKSKWVPEYEGSIKPLITSMKDSKPPPPYKAGGCCTVM